MIRVLKTLNPKPAEQFNQENTHVDQPDVIVKKSAIMVSDIKSPTNPLLPFIINQYVSLWKIPKKNVAVIM